jgi:hypothetical protein
MGDFCCRGRHWFRAFLHPPIYPRAITPSRTPAVHWTRRAPQFLPVAAAAEMEGFCCRGRTLDASLPSPPNIPEGHSPLRDPCSTLDPESATVFAPLPRQQKRGVSAAAAGDWFPGGGYGIFHVSRPNPSCFRPPGVGRVFGHRSRDWFPGGGYSIFHVSGRRMRHFPRIRPDSFLFSAPGRRTGFRPPEPCPVAAAAEAGVFCCRGTRLVPERGNHPFPRIQAESLAFSTDPSIFLGVFGPRAPDRFSATGDFAPLPLQQKRCVSILASPKRTLGVCSDPRKSPFPRDTGFFGAVSGRGYWTPEPFHWC